MERLPGVPVATITPAKKSDPATSTTYAGADPSIEYQMLPLVAGAPQLALTAASSSSVVASVVSTVSLNGSAVIAVAPAMVSFDGGAAALAGSAPAMTMAVVAVSRPNSLPDLASNVLSTGIP